MLFSASNARPLKIIGRLNLRVLTPIWNLLVITFFYYVLFSIGVIGHDGTRDPLIISLNLFGVIGALAAEFLFRESLAFDKSSLRRWILAPSLMVCVVGASIFLTVFFMNLSVNLPALLAIFCSLWIIVVFPSFFWLTLNEELSKLRKEPSIIYGAGSAGIVTVRNMIAEGVYQPIAFVDDDPKRHEEILEGVRVFGPENLAQLVNEHSVKHVFLAVPSIKEVEKRKIIENLFGLSVTIKTAPRVSELVSGKIHITDFQEAKISDLLGREPVAPDPGLLGANIQSKTVMVTGAGGSIGKELCLKIIKQNPKKLVLFELSEFALYSIYTELKDLIEVWHRDNPDNPIIIEAVLGSVQDASFVAKVIKRARVQTIYHAAAYKHVTLVEKNIGQGILNNVFGTLKVATAAQKCDVENFIFISTDKAVRPPNIMGASKRIAELVCQALAANQSNTKFCIVRFGNVLFSSGSVLPLFQKQILRGGPVTVSHPEVTRYFMTVSEAAELVIQAGAMSKGGDVFLLDMGLPKKILDLAKNMIRLAGFEPVIIDESAESPVEYGQIGIKFTGLASGEKLYEELLIGEAPVKTLHDRIITASEEMLPMDELAPQLQKLKIACEREDIRNMIKLTRELPVGYHTAPEFPENFAEK